MSRILLFLIRFYKGAISPYLGNHCRFEPTCSEYAAQAITRYGAWKGVRLAAWRILRCNPFCRGGYDPVPAPGERPGRCRPASGGPEEGA